MVIKQRIKQADLSSIIYFGNEKSIYNARHDVLDISSCGVITAEDIIKRISGASVYSSHLYLKGTEDLRKKQIEAIKKYSTEGDTDREKIY